MRHGQVGCTTAFIHDSSKLKVGIHLLPARWRLVHGCDPVGELCLETAVLFRAQLVHGAQIEEQRVRRKARLDETLKNVPPLEMVVSGRFCVKLGSWGQYDGNERGPENRERDE